MLDGIGLRTTTYDLLGYLIPGALTLMMGTLVCTHIWGLAPCLTVMKKVLGTGAVFWVAGGISSYLVGHVMNSLSSWLLEKVLLKRGFDKASDWLAIPNKTKAEAVRRTFEHKFGYLPTSADWLTVTAYLDEYKPGAAFTALRFHAFYGMSRTLALVFLLAATCMWGCLPRELSFGYKLLWSGLTFVIAILFGGQYLRFVKLHRDYLGSALFLVAAEENKGEVQQN